MKTDTYTKVLLSIIAFCLIVIALNSVEIIPRLNASNFEILDNYATVPVNEDGSINVRLISSSEVIDVNIDDVDRYAFRYCTVPVEVTNEPIRVEVD